MKFLSILPFVPMLVSAVAIISRGAETPPSGVQITSITYGGTGCNQGTLSVSVSNAGGMCPIVTKNLVAQAGPGVSVDDGRKFCQINFGITYPSGYSFTVLAVEYLGYVNLLANSDGYVQSTYYFSGSTDQVVSRVNFTGPLTTGFDKRDAVVWGTWSPCGTTESSLNVKQEVGVGGNGTIASVLENDEFVNAVVLGWKSC